MSAKKVTETAKKTAPVKASEPVKAEETVKTEAKAPVKETAVKEEEAPAKKVPEKKAEAPKKTAPKTTSKTTRTTKTEKAAVSQNVYIQFAGKEFRAEELVEQAKAAWAAEGHRASSVKSLDLYVKPEDMAAYYVINGKAAGKVDL